MEAKKKMPFLCSFIRGARDVKHQENSVMTIISEKKFVPFRNVQP